MQGGAKTRGEISVWRLLRYGASVHVIAELAWEGLSPRVRHYD